MLDRLLCAQNCIAGGLIDLLFAWKLICDSSGQVVNLLIERGNQGMLGKPG